MLGGRGQGRGAMGVSWEGGGRAGGPKGVSQGGAGPREYIVFEMPRRGAYKGSSRWGLHGFIPRECTFIVTELVGLVRGMGRPPNNRSRGILTLPPPLITI